MRLLRLPHNRCDKKPAVARAAAILGLALTANLAFAGPTLLIPAQSPQAAPAVTADSFLGTWHWMIKGESVVTMTLARSGPGFTGTMTAILGMQLDKHNNVESIQPGKNTIPLLNARIDGSVLHFETKDVDDSVQWTMTLKPDGTAEVEPSQAGVRSVKPIAAEKAH